MRHIEKELIKVFCDPMYVDWVLSVWSTLLRNSSQFAAGVKVSGILCRLSGEPFTSLMNFVFNLFHSWLAWMQQHSDDTAFWSNLDHLFIEGDDKLDGLNDCPSLEKAAVDLGLILKVEYEGPLAHANFLGRVHISFGDTFLTCAGFWRTVTKFHLSARGAGSVTGSELARAKGLSYMATDYRTPVIGALAWLMHKQNRDAVLSDSALRVHRWKLGLTSISVEDLALKPAPPFLVDVANLYGLACGVSLKTLQDAHDLAIHGIWPVMFLPPVPLDINNFAVTV
jgi:hypothetical protein